jgi:hypothetical protein
MIPTRVMMILLLLLLRNASMVIGNLIMTPLGLKRGLRMLYS